MGPLHGYRIVEFGGIGPGPFCAMMLADMGAEVIRLDRTEEADLGIKRDAIYATTNRGRRSVAINLKAPAATHAVLRLLAKADALIEGFRPGVMERLGLGPGVCLAANPRLVYGRMTGWGQSGPLAAEVGHDINYLAVAGALHSIGREGQPPSPPLNLVADLGGGAMYLAFGVVCALLEASRSGRGQVVDAAMVDGVASLLTGFYGMRAAGIWNDRRGANFVDSGAPWYDCYETSDGRYCVGRSRRGALLQQSSRAPRPVGAVAPGAIRPRGLAGSAARIPGRIQTGRTLADWCAIMDGREACFAPVLDLQEATEHPHMKERKAHIEIGGVLQPAPAPRFSRSIPDVPAPPSDPGSDTDAAMSDWGFSAAEIADLRSVGAIR